MSAVKEVLTEARKAITAENLIAAVALAAFLGVGALWVGLVRVGVML